MAQSSSIWGYSIWLCNKDTICCCHYLNIVLVSSFAIEWREYRLRHMRRLVRIGKNHVSIGLVVSSLCRSYANPLCIVLILTSDRGQRHVSTGLITVTGKRNLNLNKKQSDITTTLLNGLSLDFGKVRYETEANSHYTACKNLLRINIFSKSSINVNGMKGVLCYPVIGRLYIKITACILVLNSFIGKTVIFYINILSNDGLYILYELSNVSINIISNSSDFFSLENSTDKWYIDLINQTWRQDLCRACCVKWFFYNWIDCWVWLGFSFIKCLWW